MSLLTYLERRFRRFGIPNVTVVIIVGQMALYFANLVRHANRLPGVARQLNLDVPRILDGEVWRLISFAFVPPATGVIIFALIGWLMFHTFATGLERVWGPFRFNVFLFVAWAANVAAAFIGWYAWGIPEPYLPPSVALGISATAGNVLLYGTIFLAFARLFPDMTINLFYVLPIRIRWLALIAWVAYAYSFLRYDWPERLFIAASLANYILFFARDHWRTLKQGQRRRVFQAKATKATAAPRHVCRVCGVNSDDSPKTLFRYCSKCTGQECYCPEHIRDHEHVIAESPVA
jgi:hypothetical protein